ncbi:MAG TPA: hypothetical protein GYA10_06660 [Alphaproteobacteria bacterium]|nr:hypothetical protein [Alphaproteobacteria bacterium]
MLLAHCRAYVIAHTEAQNRSLTGLAERAGFGFVATVCGERSVSIEARHRDLVYFFVHHRLTDTAIGAVIRLIRQSPDDAIRYAPTILVSPDCPIETVLKYVRLGFDDILTLPERREVLVDRLLGQLESEHVYYETANYLGPDRRRLELTPRQGEGGRATEKPFSRLIIHRSVEHGVRVLKREMFGRTSRSLPELRRGAA